MAIELMILVDTVSLTQNGNGTGSTNANPAGCDHANAFMITDRAHAVKGNGSADLELRAESGDTLRIWGASLSNQLEDEVFIYDFEHWYGDPVLDTQGMRAQTASEYAMVPQRGDEDHNPPRVGAKKVDFNFSRLDINNPGREGFYVKFVVYGPVQDGQGTRPVKGYFRWDPSIEVH